MLLRGKIPELQILLCDRYQFSRIFKKTRRVVQQPELFRVGRQNLFGKGLVERAEIGSRASDAINSGCIVPCKFPQTASFGGILQNFGQSLG